MEQTPKGKHYGQADSSLEWAEGEAERIG